MGQDQTLAEIYQLINKYAEPRLKHIFDPNNPVLRLHEPTYRSEEVCAALETLISGNVTMGEKVFEFEKDFSRRFTSSESIFVNSGSSANLLAVAALANPACKNGSWKEGDEIIVPALCWSTTIWPLVQHKLVPVIVDVDPKTFNIDVTELEKAITPKTRGIKLVHVYGNPCEMDAIMQLVRKHDLILLEDTCEASGTTYKGKNVGTFGRIGTFSFYFSHHMTTLEGGMCITDDANLSELMRILRAHGWIRQSKNRKEYMAEYPNIDPKFLFVNQGYNFRATEVQAAIGSIQLQKLDRFIRSRQETANYWLKELSRFKDHFEFQQAMPDSKHTWFGFSIILKKSSSFTVGDMTRFLNQKGIETRPIIAGNMAIQPGMKYYPHRVVGNLQHSNHIMKNAFSFGCHQDVGPEARAWVVEVIKEFMKEHT